MRIAHQGPMPTMTASLTRPDTRRQSYLDAIEQSVCNRGGVHTRPNEFVIAVSWIVRCRERNPSAMALGPRRRSNSAVRGRPRSWPSTQEYRHCRAGPGRRHRGANTQCLSGRRGPTFSTPCSRAILVVRFSTVRQAGERLTSRACAICVQSLRRKRSV